MTPPKNPKARPSARELAHEILRAMKLPCGFLAEERDEGDGWVRMPVGHCRDCDTIVAILESLRASHEAELGAVRAPTIDECAKLVEFADLFWHDGDPRTRIATSIRSLAATPEVKP